MNKSQDGRLK